MFTLGIIRMTLFVFNGLFALSGVGILIMSAIIFQQVNIYSTLGNFIENQYTGPLITLMIVGSLVFLVALLGILGTLREHQKLITTFAVMLFAIYIVEIVISAVAFLRSNDIESSVKDSMERSFLYYTSDPDTFSAMNTMQRDLHCCGVDSPEDYQRIFNNRTVPASCCNKYDGHMCNWSIDNNVVYQLGCYDGVKSFVIRSGMTLGGVTMGLAFLEIIGIVFSVFLLISLQNEERRMGLHLHQSHQLTKEGQIAQSEEEFDIDSLK